MALCYFFFFASLGVAVPFLSPALLDAGYSKSEAGLIVAATYIFSVFVPIFGGRITDRFMTPDQMLRYAAWIMVLSASGLWWFSGERSFLFMFFLITYSAARSPMVPLQDALAMQVAKDNAATYGRMRMTGSLGFALASTGFGYVVGMRGISIFFLGLVVVCLCFAVQTLFLPRGERTHEKGSSSHFWRELGSNWWLWLSAMVLHWIAFGPFHYGYTLLLEEQGVSPEASGWYWSMGIGAEVIMFLISGWFFARWRVRHLLMVALVCNLFRWLLVGIYPHPIVLLTTQILHGFGFGLFYAAAMSAIGKFSEGKNRASYQGLFSACVGGLGSIIGSIMAGLLHDHMPMYQVMLWCVPVQLVAMVVLWFNPLRRADEAF